MDYRGILKDTRLGDFIFFRELTALDSLVALAPGVFSQSSLILGFIRFFFNWRMS
jgi:hypothetical protein